MTISQLGHTVVSIGLNVGSSEPAGQLAATLKLAAWLTGHKGNGAAVTYALGESEWEGVKERFIQFRVPGAVPHGLHIVAAQLQQDAVAYLPPGADCWRLAHADGNHRFGGSTEEFPVIV